MEKKKNLTIRVDDEFHRQVKIRLAETGMTLQSYLIKLIQNDMQKNERKED